MIEIKLQARYCSHRHCFHVQMLAGSLYAENMTVEQFLQMANDRSKPLRVAGYTLQFNGDEDGVVECSVRNYLEEVATTYVQHIIRSN